MSFSDPDHPVWGLARVVVICLTLLVLQLATATSWDFQLDGEAGTLGGTALTVALVEFLRKTGRR
jgi:uncharacterized membrane protein